MKENNKKIYRVTQIDSKITWQVEELWDGGVIRGPFGSKESAIRREEDIAENEGFSDNLILWDSVEGVVSHSDAFEKDSDGNWHCILACTIEVDDKTIALQEGMTFTKGNPFMGIDVAQWLDENS